MFDKHYAFVGWAIGLGFSLMLILISVVLEKALDPATTAMMPLVFAIYSGLMMGKDE